MTTPIHPRARGRARRVLLGVAALLALAILVVLTIGWLLPVQHRASRAATFSASPEQVFALVTAVERYPSWREGVRRVEVVARGADGSATRFSEESADGTILFEVTERIPARRVVTRIADPSLPFGGRWTFELSPTAGGTALRITEDGEVYNPLFRFASRYVMGHASSIERWLRDARGALATTTSALPDRRDRSP
ncbi:MAG TPA: SRPBCC family protein [Gemmatimonadaceae bacterium]|nr:SRPBCC family protein [Gemmatimonadaceae bacterium]